MTSRTYLIELAGVLHDDTLAALKSELDGVFKVTEPAGTVITGTTADQAALLGVFDRLHALGLQVCEFRRLPDRTEATAPRSGEIAARLPHERPAG